MRVEVEKNYHWNWCEDVIMDWMTFEMNFQGVIAWGWNDRGEMMLGLKCWNGSWRCNGKNNLFGKTKIQFSKWGEFSFDGIVFQLQSNAIICHITENLSKIKGKSFEYLDLFDLLGEYSLGKNKRWWTWALLEVVRKNKRSTSSDYPVIREWIPPIREKAFSTKHAHTCI